MNEKQPLFPFWLGGVFVALVLILIGARLSGGGANPVLVQRFAPQPVDPRMPTPQPFELPQVSLPNLPPELASRFTELRDRLAGGQAVPALTPVVGGPRVRITIDQLRRNGETLQIAGAVDNISREPVSVPSSAFGFRDSTGVLYSLDGSAGTTLQPGESTRLDLSVPLPLGRGLTMIVTLPPDPPLEQVLTVATVE